MSKFFSELLESTQQMDEIVRGERASLHGFYVDDCAAKRARLANKSTQSVLAKGIDGNGSTSRDRKQK